MFALFTLNYLPSSAPRKTLTLPTSLSSLTPPSSITPSDATSSTYALFTTSTANGKGVQAQRRAPKNNKNQQSQPYRHTTQPAVRRPLAYLKSMRWPQAAARQQARMPPSN